MNKLVVKDNALIDASYSLSLVEQRLILLAIVEARASKTAITPNTVLTITATNYIEQFGTQRNAAYQSLKDASENLFKRYFSYQDLSDESQMKSRWVSDIGYHDDKGIVKMTFARSVIPLITELETRFTQYDLEQIADLSSGYSVRLYELLIMWRSVGKTPQMSLGELRDKLGVLEREYKLMHQFKQRVLDLAINQINQHTDISATYEQHKAGRVIVGFSFTFKQKKPKTAKRKTYTHADLEKKPNLAKPGETYEQALERLNSNSKL